MKNSIKGKTKEDLAKALVEKKKLLKDFNFALSGGKTRNVREGRATKKEIARILTAMNSENK